MAKPNLNALRVFDTAARHLNFRRAAQELHLTQGAVAQQVRRLEAELRVKLFDRLPRGLALTEVGRSYFEPVHRGLQIIDDATTRLRPRTSRVTLSVPPSFASKWLVPRLANFAARHPEIDLHTIASEQLANFQTDSVDVAVRLGGHTRSAQLHYEPLAPLELCAVCAPLLADAVGPVAGLDDLVDQVLIQDSHRLWDTLFDATKLRAKRRPMQFNQTALAMDAAANGQGIALAPRLLLDDDLRQGKLVEIWHEHDMTRVGFYLVFRKDQDQNSAVTALVQWALLEAKDMSACCRQD